MILESILVWTCIYLYALTSVLLLTGFVFIKESIVRWAGWLIVPAFIAHTVIFIMRWARTGYFPANGDLENAITGGWFTIGFTVYFLLRKRAMTGVALFTVPATLLLLGYGVMKTPAPLPLYASLKSSWLIVHVLFAQLAFGAYAIGSGLGLVYLLKDNTERKHIANALYDTFPRLPLLDENMFRFVIYGFIAETIMIVAGAIWANDLWGSYWAWDPVEVWSLISWLLYGLVIHLRVTLGWKGRKLAWLMIFLLSAVIMTYWGLILLLRVRGMFLVSPLKNNRDIRATGHQ